MNSAGIARIEAMIAETHQWLTSSRLRRANAMDDSINACLAATRLNALLDCYEALGGSSTRWRKPGIRTLR